MAASDDRKFHCPHCGNPVSSRRFGGRTGFWDVARIAVIFAGVMGIIAVLRHYGG